MFTVYHTYGDYVTHGGLVRPGVQISMCVGLYSTVNIHSQWCMWCIWLPVSSTYGKTVWISVWCMARNQAIWISWFAVSWLHLMNSPLFDLPKIISKHNQAIKNIAAFRGSSQYKDVVIGIPILKIRRSLDRLIFNMGILTCRKATMTVRVDANEHSLPTHHPPPPPAALVLLRDGSG